MSDWNEADHPRVPGGDVNGGQFTEKQIGAAVTAARKAAGSGPIEEDAMRMAKMIADLDHEELYAFRPDGKIARAVGDKDSVAMTSYMERSMRGAIVLHNHPGGAAHGMFSDSDLITASYQKVSQMWLSAGDVILKIKMAAGWQWDAYKSMLCRGAIADRILLMNESRYFDPLSEETLEAVVAGYKDMGLDASIEKWR